MTNKFVLNFICISDNARALYEKVVLDFPNSTVQSEKQPL